MGQHPRASGHKTGVGSRPKTTQSTARLGAQIQTRVGALRQCMLNNGVGGGGEAEEQEEGGEGRPPKSEEAVGRPQPMLKRDALEQKLGVKLVFSSPLSKDRIYP